MERLNAAQAENPCYGVERLAILLGWSRNKTFRIRNLLRTKSPEMALKCATSRLDPKLGRYSPPNLLRDFWALKSDKQGYSFTKLTDPHLKIWVQDFTRICFQHRFYYLAVIMSPATRQVLGWSFGDTHTADLVCQALEEALSVNDPPEIVHNDRGSEYLSIKHCLICQKYHIQMSASEPGKPWQNGFMESFFHSFKRETKKELQAARTPEELLVIITKWLDYYGHERIHSALKMTPAEYARKLLVDAN